jgi:membrane-associated progesterone receptor component
MTTLRERKAARMEGAHASNTPTAVDSNSYETSDGTVTTGTDANDADATPIVLHPHHGLAHRARVGPNWIQRIFSFIPFILLFFAIFCTISYLQTGTLDYGLARPLARQGISFTHLRHRINRGRIAIAEFLGLRAPSIRKAKPTSPTEGYDGISQTKSQREAAAARSAAQSAGVGLAPGQPGYIPNENGVDEKPLARMKIPKKPKIRDPNSLYLTPAQLAKYDGTDPADPTILLSVYGRLFDVTSGRGFYGPDGGYNNLAARDISRAFATSCFIQNPKNYAYDIRGLTDEQLRVR